MPTDETLESQHRKVFDQLAGEAKVIPAALNTLWATSGYAVDPQSDVINEDAIKVLIANQKPAQPFLFEPPEPLPGDRGIAGPGNSRGNLARETFVDTVEVSKHAMANPQAGNNWQLWDQKKQGEVAAALKQGKKLKLV